MKNINLSQELPRFIDSACIPIFVVDVNQNVCQWNQAIKELSGYNIAEINDLGISSIFIEKDKKRLEKIIDDSIQQRTTKSIGMSFQNKNGNIINLILSSSTRCDAEGQVTGAVVIGQDVSELQNTPLQLVHASKIASPDDMSISLVHELNQPLNVISMTASNVLRKITDNINPEYLLMKLEKIKSQAFRAGEIAQQIRIFSRHSKLEKESINTHRSISAAKRLKSGIKE